MVSRFRYKKGQAKVSVNLSPNIYTPSPSLIRVEDPPTSKQSRVWSVLMTEMYAI